MIDIRKYFELAFDDELTHHQISRPNLQRFSEKHLAALVYNNTGGKYDAIIAFTATAFNNFFGNIEDRHLAVAIQKSKTRVNDLALTQFEATVDKYYYLIAFKFPKDTPIYLEFFPRGKDEYNNVLKVNALILMDTIISACTTHVAEITQPVVDEFTAIRALFSSSRTEQLQKMEVVDTESSEISETRTALEFQLNRNILILALEYLGNVDRGMDFFDQQYLGRTGATGEGTTPAPVPAPVPPAPASITMLSDQTIPGMVTVDVTGNSLSTGAELLTATWDTGIFNTATPANGIHIIFQWTYTAAGIKTIALTGDIFTIGEINIANNKLTSFTPAGSNNVNSFNASANALNADSINSILIYLDENTLSNGWLMLSGGTNAAPSGQGIAAKNHLIAKGWRVTTN